MTSAFASDPSYVPPTQAATDLIRLRLHSAIQMIFSDLDSEDQLSVSSARSDQRMITALIVQDFLGGSLAQIRDPHLGGVSTLNVLEGQHFDLSTSLHPIIAEANCHPISRREILSVPGADPLYKILKAKILDIFSSFRQRGRENLSPAKK